VLQLYLINLASLTYLHTYSQIFKRHGQLTAVDPFWGPACTCSEEKGQEVRLRLSVTAMDVVQFHGDRFGGVVQVALV